MLRERIMRRLPADRPGFRWRGTEVGRLEGLSDAVFGFAITLLVISMEVPRTATELFDAMRGMVAFAICFALLFLVWYHQYRFFRRYGLEDGVTMVLNAVLLFVIVFFVYPLKFVFGRVVESFTGNGWNERLTLPDGTQAWVFAEGQGEAMMVVYSGGYVAVFLIFALLHLHAWRLRDALELNALERHDTVDNVRESLLNVGIGTVSIVLALTTGEAGAFLAGMVYWLLGPVLGLNGWLSGRRRRRLMERLAAGGDPAAA